MRALIGVEIAVEVVRVACVSLLGEVLHSESQPLRDRAPGAACAQVARMVSTAHRHLLASGLRASGIGVGVPGAVEDATGLVRFAPNLGWRNLSLLPELGAALAAAGVAGVNVQLQNDADAAALGEFEFSEGEGEDPLIFVSCDVGVGAGVVLNDRLFTGAQGMAGEIGHTILRVDGPLCSCGRRGCAEAFLGSRVLASGRREAKRGAAFLGVLLQNLWVTFEPRAIVVGGKSWQAHPELLPEAIDTVQSLCAERRHAAAGGARRALRRMGAGGGSGGTRVARVPSAAPSGFEGTARARRARGETQPWGLVSRRRRRQP